jgi:DNA polymerase-3 subunit delta
MIHFIYGEDTFRSLEALKKIELDFVKSEGDLLNIDKLDGSDLGQGVLESKVQALPFLGSKRLIIVRNLLSEGKKEIKKDAENLLKSIPETSILAFFEEGTPDKRESLYKMLDKLPNRQFYPQLEGFGLRDWISKKAIDNNSEITRESIEKLILFVGPDLFRLDNELSSLSLFVQSQGRKKIEVNDVEKLVEPNNNFKIFDLTDAIAAKNAKKALQVLYAFRKSGEDEFKIFNLIIHQIRTMLVVNDLLRRKFSSDQIAKEAGIHPFVAKKTTSSLRGFSGERLFVMHNQLLETDWQVKSGQLDMISSLEMLIVDFCQR